VINPVKDLIIKNLVVRSLDVDSKELTWELGDGTGDAIDFTLEVMRSESPAGPYDVISPPFEDRYIFVDRRLPLGAKYVLLHYKLRITNRRTGEVTEVGPAAQTADIDLVAQSMRRLEMTYFTQVVGRACWLFKKRTFGPRCRNCWDSTLQKRTVDRCMDCFSTGVLRGYHNPIEVWVQIDPTTKAQQNNAQQIAEFVSTTGRMSHYPNVIPGDVLVEAENKRWRVQSVTTTERLRAVVKQEFVMRQIEEKDIEYRLPIRIEKALRDIQPSPVRMFENATDLNASIDNRTADIFEGFMTYGPYAKYEDG
jgi:hypothetical protein